MGKTKQQAECIHAIRRICQRVKGENAVEVYYDLVRSIRNGKGLNLPPQSNRVSRKLLKIEKEWFVVCYDKKRHEIITVMPAEWVDDAAEKLKEIGCLK